MKKLLAIALAIMMMMTIAVPAFAAVEADAVVNSTKIFVNDVALTDETTAKAGDVITCNFTVSGGAWTEDAYLATYVALSNDADVLDNFVDTTNCMSLDDETGKWIYYVRESEFTFGFQGTVTEANLEDGAVNVILLAEFTDYYADIDGNDVTQVEIPINIPAENSTNPLTGETIDGVTHSFIGEGSTLNLDTDYVIDVTGKLDADNDGIPDEEEDDPTPIPETPTIAVDIYWTDMVFNYQQQWNETTLTYDWNWQNGEDYIKVDNRSSVGINAGITFTGDTTNGYDNDAVEFEFMEDSAVAATWAEGVLTLGYGNQATEEQLAEDATTVVTPSGTLNVNVAATTTMDTDTTDETAGSKTVTLGQITVNISAIIPPQTVTLGTVTAGTEHGINGGSFEARLYDTCKVVIDGLPSNDYNWVAAVEFACSFSDYFQPEWSFEKDDAGNWVLTFVLTPSYDGIDGTLVAGDTVEVYMPYIECADVEDNYTCLFTVTIVE